MIKHLLLLAAFVLPGTLLLAQQEKTPTKPSGIIPFVEVAYGVGLCGESNPLSYTAGIKQPLSRKLSLIYDINVWSTPYEIYCCDIYSKGRYTAVTPSVKLQYNLGKRPGRGFFMGAGIGYMIARDRGTEQPFTYGAPGEMIFTKSPTETNWDFNSIAPSVNFGYEFRIGSMPMAITSTTYFAKTTCNWQAVSSGIGLRIGFKKRK